MKERNIITKELTDALNVEEMKIIKTYTYTDYMVFVIINDKGWNKERINDLKEMFAKNEYFNNYHIIFKKFGNELIIHLRSKQ